MLATNANLALRGLTCESLFNVVDVIPDVAAAYNAHVIDRHPHRLKTMPMALRHCFLESVKQYLTKKVCCRLTRK
jgi:hypothetical protein